MVPHVLMTSLKPLSAKIARASFNKLQDKSLVALNGYPRTDDVTEVFEFENHDCIPEQDPV